MNIFLPDYAFLKLILLSLLKSKSATDYVNSTEICPDKPGVHGPRV